MTAYDEQQLTASLQEWWGYDRFKAGQLDVIAQVMSGRDTLALMPTGAGKSLCYQLPAMRLPGLTLVISPLIALMKDQYDNLPAQLYEKATFINSTLEARELEQRLDDLIAGKYKLVYAAPERLRQRTFVDALKRADLGLLVIDEAHCVSLWGHDFRPDYLFIKKALPLLGEPQLLALTATATPPMQTEIGVQLGRDLERVQLSTFRHNLRYEVRKAGNAEAKLRLLVELCKEEQGSGIVYATSRDNCEKVAQTLQRNGVKAEFYHAGLEKERREAVQDRFMLDRTRIIVATVAFGMGVDKANVRFIAHFNLPKSLEAYAQESGRAGRDGKPARCVLLYSSSDKGNLTAWGRRDQLDVPLLRAVYKAVREGLRDGISQPDGTTSGLVYTNELLRSVNSSEVGDVDETKLRVAISLLERAGLLNRHLDAPRNATVTLHDFLPTRIPAPDRPMFEQISDDYRLRPAIAATLDMVATARPLKLAPDELEAKLLDWQAAGLLAYKATGRDMVLALRRNPGDASGLISQLLEQQDRAMAERLAQMNAYAEAERCRHQQIAAHLGERLARCGDSCDVCDPPAAGERSTWEQPVVPEVANPGATILACVQSLPFSIGRTGLAQILAGSVGAPVREDRSEYFGVLSYASRKAVMQAIDELLAAGYLELYQKGEYPLLRPGPRAEEEPPAGLTRLAPKRVANPQRRELRREWHETATDSGRQQAEVGGFDDLDDEGQDIFERLRAWRTSVARREGMPPYVIFQDRTLRDVARLRPRDEATLRRCYGMGEARLAKYGAEVLAVLWGTEGNDTDAQPTTAVPTGTTAVERHGVMNEVPSDAPAEPQPAGDGRGVMNEAATPYYTLRVYAPERPIIGDGRGVTNEATTPGPDWKEYQVHGQVTNHGQAIVDCVRSLPVTVRRNELGYILIGSAASNVKPNRCRYHGLFASAVITEVTQAIDQLLEAGYLSLDHEGGQQIGIGERSLHGEVPPPDLVVVPPSQKAGMNREPALPGRLNVLDPDELTADQKVIYQRLLEWRQQVCLRDAAKLTNIFYSSSLRSIAALMPHSIPELRQAYGVDPGRVVRYGVEILNILWDTDVMAAAMLDKPAGLSYTVLAVCYVIIGRKVGSAAVALVGSLAEFQLVNVIALLQVERKTGELTLQHEDQQTVRLYLQEGRVVHAESSSQRGPTAPTDGFDLALSPFIWPDGKFHFEQYEVEVPQPNITQGNAALMTEGRNRAAAAREMQQSVPSGALVIRLLHTPGQQIKSINLDYREWRFLTMVDGERDITAISQLLGVDELQGRQIASRMLKNDLVEKVDLRQKMHRLHAYTGEDYQQPDVAAMDDLALDVLLRQEAIGGEVRIELLTEDELRRERLRVAGLANLSDRLLLAPAMMAKLGLSNGDPIYVRLRDNDLRGEPACVHPQSDLFNPEPLVRAAPSQWQR